MNAGRSIVRFSLRGGVMAIGSLYWQDHLYDASNTIRQDWRTTRLDMDGSFSVRVPIRYGRLSESPVDRRKTYTMVFDNRLQQAQYGTGRAMPFSLRSFGDFKSIKAEVHWLSAAEGHDRDFIKGPSAWAVCSILFHPERVRPEVKKYLLDRWKTEFEAAPEKYRMFMANLHNGTHYAVRPSGELDIPWPSEANQLDFLLATATLPIPREALDRLAAGNIADLVPNRHYFHKNVQHGITTFQDEEILRCLGDEA